MHQPMHIIKWTAGGTTTSKSNQQALAGHMRSLINTRSLAAIVIFALVNQSEAIVKLQASQQQQQQQVSQQSKSDQSQPLVDSNGQQQAPGAHNYNNHQFSEIISANNRQQSPGSIQSDYEQQLGNTPSSRISVSSSSSGPNANPNFEPTSSGRNNNNGHVMQLQHQQQLDQQMNVDQSADFALSNSQKPSSLVPSSASYSDSMIAAASNSDPSHQATDQNVNMELTNSDIYNSGNYAPQQQQRNQSQQQQSQYSGSANSLNPLHYFYYPAKDQAQGAAGNGQLSNNYDQLNSALPSHSGSRKEASVSSEAASSNQDSSYLQQPMTDTNNQQSNQYSQINGQQQQPQQSYGADLSAYASNNQQQPSSITLSGLVSSNFAHQHPEQQPNYNQQLSVNNFMNLQLGQDQQQTAGGPSYQSASSFNGVADLSTSNFDNNGDLSSVAAYLSPSSNSALNLQQQKQTTQGANDIFSHGPFGQQFNSAASQLNPAAIPPTQPTSGSTGRGSSLFGAASSLLDASQLDSNGANQQAPSIFSDQHYLNSFIPPQQFAPNSDQQQQMLSVANNPSLTSLVPSTLSGSSGKRFGIGSFIMPMLALAGLSLLIPTMSNIGTAVGRKKRSIVEEKASSSNRKQQINYHPMNGLDQVAKETSISEYLDQIERFYSMYKNAVGKDADCLNQMICEFGDAVKDVTANNALSSIIEKLVPNWKTGKSTQFKGTRLNYKSGI